MISFLYSSPSNLKNKDDERDDDGNGKGKGIALDYSSNENFQCWKFCIIGAMMHVRNRFCYFCRIPFLSARCSRKCLLEFVNELETTTYSMYSYSTKHYL